MAWQSLAIADPDLFSFQLIVQVQYVMARFVATHKKLKRGPFGFRNMHTFADQVARRVRVASETQHEVVSKVQSRVTSKRRRGTGLGRGRLSSDCLQSRHNFPVDRCLYDLGTSLTLEDARSCKPEQLSARLPYSIEMCQLGRRKPQVPGLSFVQEVDVPFQNFQIRCRRRTCRAEHNIAKQCQNP